MLFVYLYLIQLIIRPQDFSEPFLGLPTAWLIIVPGFILGALKNFSNIAENRAPHYKLLLAFLMVIIFSTAMNAGSSDAISQANIFLNRIIAFFMIHMLVDTEARLKNTLLAYIILAAVLGIHATMQLKTGVGFSGVPPLTHYDPWRAVWVGDWDGSNSFGVIFLTAIPLSLEFIIGRHSIWIRIIGLSTFPLIIAGLYFVDSRGDIIAALFALACYAAFKFSKKTNILLLVTAILFLGSLLPSRMAEVSTTEESAHERTWVWEQGIGLLLDHPVLGVGSGQFVRNTSSGLVAHSNYVTAFSELGLLGFFLFLSILWLSLKCLLNVFINGSDFGSRIKYLVGLKEVGKKEDELLRGMAISLFASLCGFYGATFFIVLWNDLLFFFWAVSASLWSIVAFKNNSKIKFNSSDIMIVTAGMIIIITVIWYIAVIS